MIYKTKKKKTVEDIFLSRKGECFTAENIIETLKAEGTAVSTATVYRHLDSLVKQGKIAKIPTQSGSFLYQYGKCDTCVCEHCSLMCVECGKVIHMDCDEFSKLSLHVKQEHGFHIDHFKTVIYGKCSSCEKENFNDTTSA